MLKFSPPLFVKNRSLFSSCSGNSSGTGWGCEWAAPSFRNLGAQDIQCVGGRWISWQEVCVWRRPPKTLGHRWLLTDGAQISKLGGHLLALPKQTCPCTGQMAKEVGLGAQGFRASLERSQITSLQWWDVLRHRGRGRAETPLQICWTLICIAA